MRILRDFGPRGGPSWPSWSGASLSRSLLAVRAGGFCVAPQAGPKIRALGAPLGHCERRPSATGPFQWPKKDRLRQQRTGACCCAVARGPRPGVAPCSPALCSSCTVWHRAGLKPDPVPYCTGGDMYHRGRKRITNYYSEVKLQNGQSH